MNYGTLYITATPIGNLKDITIRALEILKEVDFIICEDTRVTSILLKEYEISKELFSFNAQSEERKIPIVIERLQKGESAAQVSDAGTPGISDPGVRLVNACLSADIEVCAIPGANAAVAALSIAGLPTDSFLFEGFLPQKKGRQKKLKLLSGEQHTVVLYESTYRIEKLLNELNEYMPERHIVVCRELTKKFEEYWRGKPGELIETLPERTVKGEFVVIISPPGWS